MKNILLCLALCCIVYTHPGVANPKLEEVIVISSGVKMPIRQVGTSVSIVKKDEIHLRGYRSLVDLLRTQVGISATNAGGPGKTTSVRVRGEEGYRTLVMVDGVEISDPTATQVGPQIQHLATSDDIERVEILRGPQGFIYGADAGGVINILTRAADTGNEGAISAELGRYDSSKTNGFFATGSDSGDLFVSFTDIRSEGFNARSDFSDSEDDGYENTTVHTKIGWNDEDQRVQFVLRDVSAENDFDNCGLFSSENCVGTYEQTIGRLSFEHEGDVVGHRIAWSKTEISRENRTDGVRSFLTEGSSEKAEALSRWTISPFLVVLTGADGEREIVEQRVGDDLSRDQLAAFAEFQLDANDFFLTAGARYDDNEDFGHHISVRLSSAYLYALSDTAYLKYRASFGTGFRAPSLFELDYNNSDFAFGDAALIELKEENSEGFDLGIEYFHESGIALNLTYFRQKIKNEIFFDIASFSGYLQGEGESESEGAELGFNFPLSELVGLQGNYTYNDTQSTLGDQRPRRPENIANIAINIRLAENRLTMLANLRVVRGSKDNIFAVGTVDLDDYEVLDISANYQLTPSVNFFGRIENAMDEDYQELTSFNASGASVYAGIKYQF